MKQSTLLALLRAYVRLQELADDLYMASQEALDNDNYDDANLLQNRADKLYEEAENLDTLVREFDNL